MPWIQNVSPYRLVVFIKLEVIATELHAEYNGSHTLKTVDPLLPSERWPPTSTILKVSSLKVNLFSQCLWSCHVSAECPQQLGCTRALKCGPGRLDNRMYCPLGGTRWSGKSTPAHLDRPTSASSPQELWRESRPCSRQARWGRRVALHHKARSGLWKSIFRWQGHGWCGWASQWHCRTIRGLYSLQASRLKTPLWMIFICFTMVLLPELLGPSSRKFDLHALRGWLS